MYRGGRGVIVEYVIQCHGATVTAYHNRSKEGPWAIGEGKRGSVNELGVLHSDGRYEVYGHVTAYPLVVGDTVVVTTAQGGGFGDPLRRERAAVEDDLRNGYITADQARRHYGLAPAELA